MSGQALVKLEAVKNIGRKVKRVERSNVDFGVLEANDVLYQQE